MKDYIYDIAISFAGEQRIYAQQLANKLTQCHINVFYDKWSPVDAWGKDLYEYLSQIYLEKAKYIVVLFSKEYINKQWPHFEFELIRNNRIDSILPITIDNTLPDQWPSERAYISANDYSIDEIALMIRSKVFDIKYTYDTNELLEYEPIILLLTNDDGTVEECEMITSYTPPNSDREYIIYTTKDVDNKGYVELQVSLLIEKNDGTFAAVGVPDEDWPLIKSFLRELGEDGDDLPPLCGTFKMEDGTEILI